MDLSTVFNRQHNPLFSPFEMVLLPLSTETHTKVATLSDVDLFDLKRAYNVPLDVPVDLSKPQDRHHSGEEDDESRQHHPMEFCESQIDEGEIEDACDDVDDVSEQQEELKYRCCHCVFEGPILELRNHYSCHHQSCVRSNWCTYCQVDFESEAVFKLHQSREHILYCPKCFDSFKTQHQLLAHISVHSKVKGNECPICKKVFPVRRYFLRHLERHEKKEKMPEEKMAMEKPDEIIFKCTNCQKEFTKKESLVKHMKIHTRDTLKCSLCDFTCGKKVTLKMHVISHEGNRKYKCEHCDFSFKQIGHLKRHIARFNH